MLLLRKDGIRVGRINWWGMFFALWAIIIVVALIAYALYLDKQWLAGILGGGTLISIVSIFVKNNEEKSQSTHKKG